MSPFALALLIASDAVVLALAIRARAPWALRASVVVLVLSVAFAIWSAASDDAGWPARTPFPDRAAFVGCIALEPAPGFKGAIYLWLVPPSGSRNPLATAPSQGEPRSYQEPYSLDLEAACQQAQKIAKAGGQAAIRSTGRKGRHGRRGALGPRVRYRAYVLPSPKPPTKG